MRVLLIGGAGHVAGLILPYLRERHEVRVLDVRAPDSDVDHVVGDAADPEVVARAVDGMDVVLHCAMAQIRDDMTSAAYAVTATHVHVASVQVTLQVAHEAGVRHAVVIGSMSVFRDLFSRTGLTEQDTPDAIDPYGLTKRFGEQVCAAAAEWGMSVNVLRLAWPTSDEAWPAWENPDGIIKQHTVDGDRVPALAASDLARAMLAALEHRDGFQIFTISGDHEGRIMSLAKARDVLGWEPAHRLE